MITKERLEHLQKNGATVWQIKNNGEFNIAIPIKLDKVSIKYSKEGIEVKSDVYMLFKVAEAYNQIYFIKYDELTESEQDAEFINKYQGITRTETLSLPSWEEITTNDKYNYYGTSYFEFGDGYRLIVKLPSEDDDCEFIGIDVNGNCELYHWEEATKENYTEACRLAKKLFLGENAND